jgi:hypothetical protein
MRYWQMDNDDLPDSYFYRVMREVVYVIVFTIIVSSAIWDPEMVAKWIVVVKLILTAP